ncbi:MAG: HAMP domain-containing histidine kinase, partial [Myxococcota bacterium]|nr:HAMP domain-containing histidine kinase [Myxococcota bacterium]
SALRVRVRQYEMRELLTELARAATERERLLCAEREARATAEAANCAKDEFLATLSHELRTPMNVILGWTAMLVSGAVPPEKRPEALSVIDRNARMQTQLIQDLLDVSSIVSGKMRLNLQAADWRSVVELAIDTVRPTAELKDIAIEAVFDSRGMAIRGDPDRLLQIASNLLTNAVKFTPPGGRVRVRLESLENAERLTVSDTGRGIPTDFLPFVFDRFRQADGSTTRKFGGLGLGLAIVRHLTDLHGGSVDVWSDGEGKGATFSVTLPRTSRG